MPESSDECPSQWLSPREFAKSLRRAMPAPERRLWKHLRDRRLAGLKFVRQAPLGKFVVDFLCREQRLIVELDGESHTDRGRYDLDRIAGLDADAWMRGELGRYDFDD